MSDRSKVVVAPPRIALVLLVAAVALIPARGPASRAAAETVAAAPPAAPLEFALATRMEAIVSGTVGRLEIPRVGLAAPILDGVAIGVMDRGVGRILGTAYPGEAGVVALAAHRTTHFRQLGQVTIGDRVRVRTPDGVFEYRADAAFVADPKRTDILRGDGTARLALITCFPFDWKGPAPLRYVVLASAIGADLSTTNRKVAVAF
jgi:sortase A